MIKKIQKMYKEVLNYKNKKTHPLKMDILILNKIFKFSKPKMKLKKTSLRYKNQNIYKEA